MAIVLARVDDRVIHGQTTTRWVAVKPADAILVISDKIAADQLRCKVLKAAAGKLKLGIYTLAQGPEALAKAQASAKNFFVISDSIRNFADLVKIDGDFGGVLNIGNLNATREGTKNMGNTVMMNDEDVVALDELEAAGIDLQQIVPRQLARHAPAVAGAFEIIVVQQKDLPVLRQLDVKFNHRVPVAGANVDSRQGVLRRQFTAAAMGDDAGIRPVTHARCPVSPSKRCRCSKGRCSHSVLPAAGRC